MMILAIETSCDETGVSVVEGNINSLKILSNVVSSSILLHAKTGGIIPEVAAREQVSYMIPAIEKALQEIPIETIDAIAVTIGPGLIGSLLVGVETAKTLAYVYKKPIIPVNHLIGHIYANWVEGENINPKIIEFPVLSLIVSGGHTDLVFIKNHGNIKWLGGTRDDAAGEAFDKIGRLLELPYPGGPEIEKRAKIGNYKKYNFPKPLIDSGDFDFSFSGLKTAVLRETINLKEKQNGKLSENDINDICASTQKTVIEILIHKTLVAAKEYQVKSILLGGGVSANQKLEDELILNTKYQMPNTDIFVPQKYLCTDNAAMIGAAAFFNDKKISWEKITANPELYFD
jgi:N6-L-threonylcarbamoyladenine synthase